MVVQEQFEQVQAVRGNLSLLPAKRPNLAAMAHVAVAATENLCPRMEATREKSQMSKSFIGAGRITKRWQEGFVRSDLLPDPYWWS